MFSQKETFHIFLAYKELVPRLCGKKKKKQLLQLNNKKISYTILKTGKRFEQGLYKRSCIDQNQLSTPKMLNII